MQVYFIKSMTILAVGALSALHCLCCWVCVASFERWLTPLCVDCARALWASFCFRSCQPVSGSNTWAPSHFCGTTQHTDRLRHWVGGTISLMATRQFSPAVCDHVTAFCCCCCCCCCCCRDAGGDDVSYRGTSGVPSDCCFVLQNLRPPVTVSTTADVGSDTVTPVTVSTTADVGRDTVTPVTASTTADVGSARWELP